MVDNAPKIRRVLASNIVPDVLELGDGKHSARFISKGVVTCDCVVCEGSFFTTMMKPSWCPFCGSSNLSFEWARPETVLVPESFGLKKGKT